MAAPILLAQAWHNCAAFYCRTGDLTNALSCAENSIKTQNNFRPPHVLIGCSKMEQGRYALRISGGGRGLFEMDPAALYMFGHIAEHRGQWMVSRSAYQSLVKEDDTLQTAQRKSGEMNIRISRYNDASVALSAAVTLDPTDATSYFC